MILTDAERARQLARCTEALAECEREHTPEELAIALELLERDPMQPQTELKLG